MVTATKMLAKGRRPTGDESFVVTDGGSIIVNVKKLVSGEGHKRAAAMVRKKRGYKRPKTHSVPLVNQAR